MKEIKDYLHFYLAGSVQVEYDGRIGNVYTYYHPAGKYNVDMVWVASLEDSNDPELSCEASINKCKLLLRPLSDMTDEEAKEIGFWSELHDCKTGIEKEHAIYDLYTAEKFRLALSKSFDLFGLIEAGLAIDKTKL